MKRLVLFVMENGLIIALMIGTAAILSFGVLSDSTMHSIVFLMLGLVGVAFIVGIMKTKKYFAAVEKQSEAGSKQ